MYTLLQQTTERHVWEQTKADAEIIFKFKLESVCQLTPLVLRVIKRGIVPFSLLHRVKRGGQESRFLCVQWTSFQEDFFVTLLSIVGTKTHGNLTPFSSPLWRWIYRTQCCSSFKETSSIADGRAKREAGRDAAHLCK